MFAASGATIFSTRKGKCPTAPLGRGGLQKETSGGIRGAKSAAAAEEDEGEGRQSEGEGRGRRMRGAGQEGWRHPGVTASEGGNGDRGQGRGRFEIGKSGRKILRMHENILMKIWVKLVFVSN